MFSTQQQRGFTLVELLISMALGVVIAGAAINVYIESKLSYMQDEELARMQENARFAMDFLKREITLSGFMGGIADASSLAPTAVTSDCGNGSNWALDISTPFELVNATDGSTTPTSINGTTWNCIDASELIAGTDLFSIKRTADAPTLRNGSMQTFNEDLNQWYLRAFDYNDFSWNYLTGAIPGNEKTAGSTYDYWEYYAKIFFIREFTDLSADGIPSLCQSILVGSAMTTQCLIEGIEDLQIEVGLDADNDSQIERYKVAPASADFENIKSIRVHLLVRSVNEVPGYTNDKTYTLGEKAVSAFNDGYMRKVFTTTVRLRNVNLG